MLLSNQDKGCTPSVAHSLGGGGWEKKKKMKKKKDNPDLPDPF